jgi:hypothetical protein
MSTRSVVALPLDGGWKGRYVHSDGYPEARVPTLLALIERDGIDAVISEVIEENYGWSYLNPDQTRSMHEMYRDGRFIPRTGYGVAYTLDQAGGPEGEWLTNTSADALFIEWVYVLGQKQMNVLESVRSEDEKTWTWRHYGYVRYDDGDLVVIDHNQTALV